MILGVETTSLDICKFLLGNLLCEEVVELPVEVHAPPSLLLLDRMAADEVVEVHSEFVLRFLSFYINVVLSIV